MKYLFFKKQKEIFYFIILFFFSILINQHYGYLGLNPIDIYSFNSGYDILNGYYPFKDYWTITGPFIALTQAFFFKLFGISWFSFVFHASIFNFLISICTFFTLYKFKLKIEYCFLYALFVSILGYPSAGTPYVDHHSSYLSIISIFCFVLALKTNLKIYWFVLPIILGISFLSKQTPSGYFFLIIFFLSIIHFIFNFNIRKIVSGFLGSIFIVGIFLITLQIGDISFLSFVEQYVLYPLSIGENRLEFIFPLEFKRVILRYKLIHLSTLLLLILSIKKIVENCKYIKTDEFLITISLILSSYALITHQLMTVNGMFIFFIIPILTGFSHIYYLKYFKKKNYIFYLLLFLAIGSTFHYAKKYIHTRDFADLRKINLKSAIDAKVLDNKLEKLQWITPLYPNKPREEINGLVEAVNIIKNDTKNKAIITDYQFISVILSIYDNSPSQVWFINHVLNEKNKSKYFKIYKNFLINRFKENEIEIVYTVKPLWGGNDVFEKALNEDCIKKNIITKILDSYILLQCDELKN